MSSVERGYKIRVEYNKANERGLRVVTDMFVSSNAADLALMLHALDESPLIAQVSVFNTITIPQLKVLGPLTKNDLGLVEMKKLR